MPIVSVRIDSQSRYSIEFRDEYSPKEFIETIQKQIKFVNEIASDHKRLNPPEITAVQHSDLDGPAAIQEEQKPADVPGNADASPGTKIIRRKSFLFAVFIIALVCGGAIYLWLSDFGIIPPEKAPAPQALTSLQSAPPPAAVDPQNQIPITAQKPEKKNTPPLPKLNRMVIAAHELTWMRIAEDGNPAYEIMLRPGDRLEREAVTFALNIGNAKGVDIKFNNKQIELKRRDLSRRTRNVVFLRLPN